MHTVRLVTVVREIWDGAYCETGDSGEGDMGQCIL